MKAGDRSESGQRSPRCLCGECERVEYGAVIKRALAQHRGNEIVGMAGYVYNTQKQYHMVVGLVYGVGCVIIEDLEQTTTTATNELV